MVIFSGANRTTLSTGRKGRLRQLNRSILPTVYTPVRGMYWPLIKAARAG